MLPEIIILSEIRGLVKINDVVLGEADGENYQSFIAPNSFYLSFIPFTQNKIYAELQIKIEVLEGVPKINCAYGKIFNYKGGVYLLELFPPCLAMHTLPVCRGYKQIEGRFSASLMEQNGIYLVIEDEKREYPDSFFNLSFEKQPFIDAFFINHKPFIIASDNARRIYVIAMGKNGFYLELCADAVSYKLKSDGLEVKYITPYKHTLLNTYIFNGNRILLARLEYKAREGTAEDIAADFLECVKYGIKEKAVFYLADDLKLTFEEISGFLGGFSRFKKSPFEENAYALIGEKDRESFLVNRFAFEIEKGKIINIKEL
ncbi:MAG: hypothetical protein IJR47_04485 [Clostridia bacterium]|nr:hypothetical protein [Clostridia bacterium]